MKMVKAVAPGVFGTSHQVGGGSKAAPITKRKTPSELRGEQLKRTSFVDQASDSFDALRACKSSNEKDNGTKKQDQLKNPKYIEMCMDELYPVKKPTPWTLPGKENAKESSVKEQSKSLKNVSLLSNVSADKRQQLIRIEEKNVSAEVPDRKAEAQTTEKCSQSLFRSVTELSSRGEDLSCLTAIDMSKALKGLAPCEPLPVHPSDMTGKSYNTSLRGNFMSEFHVPGEKIPLDLSMKTYARLVSSSTLNWLHRSIMGSTFDGMPQQMLLPCNVANNDKSGSPGTAVVSQVLNSMSLHSWVYPQSTLPPFIISALVASEGDRGEVDFLQKRQLAWEDSFRNLYFMLRKNHCNIFYVCTSQFVAMFMTSCDSGSAKRSCIGYVSQSTRRLRAMLKELDVCYTMPLCETKIDQATVEDLVELSEMEKHNLGQTRRSSSFSNIDNTPESLLAFIGNENVHGLYDLLLNYRSSLGFLPTADVPVIYSPAPFQNAALSSPEIKCTEMVRTEHTGSSAPGTHPNGKDWSKPPSTDRYCLVEIKGEYLPPWIISNICANLSAQGQNFEASFTTEQTTTGLNMALQQVHEKTDPESPVTEATVDTTDASGVRGTVICPQLRSGHLKSLKYCDKSYIVSLSPS